MINKYLHYKYRKEREVTKTFAFSTPAPKLNQGINGKPNPLQPRQSSEEVTMRDLQMEQSRLQRQQTQIQHQKSQLLLRNEIAKRREVVQLQKLKKEENDDLIKNAIRARKEEKDSNDEVRLRNASLYKPKPGIVPPVGMPKNKI